MYSESEFYKWRFLIALAHVDGKLMREEQQFLREKIQEHAPEGMHHRLFDEMMEDMLSPKPPDLFFYKIEEAKDKVDVLNLAHMLFWADGDFGDEEKAFLDEVLEAIKADEATLSLLKEDMASWDGSEAKTELKAYVEGRV